MSKMFFSADTHIGHEAILQYIPHRPYASHSIVEHDKWLINLWQTTVGKHDRLYFAGDLTFRKSEEAKRLLEILPGEKYLAIGNHDESIKAHLNYFCKASQIVKITLKPSVCDCLKEELHIVMCHYPMLDWPGKYQGAVMLHGHCHGTMDKYNSESQDLRFDIGIDSELAKRANGFIDLETLCEAILEKTNGLTSVQYTKANY